MTVEIKLFLYGLGKNQFLMRIENIVNIFYSDGKVIFYMVNVKQIAKDLFNIENRGKYYHFSEKIVQNH